MSRMRRDRPARSEMGRGAGGLCDPARADARSRRKALKAHVLTQLARFKVPREIVFVDDLPRTALGKVQHFMLRQLDEPVPAQGETS